VDVDATVISVKGMRITRGDLPICEARKKKLAELAAPRGVVMDWQKSAEGIVGLSSTGPKARTSRQGEEAFISMVKEMPTKREEKPKFPGGGSGRNLRDKPAKASSTTAMKEMCVKNGLNRRIRNRTSGGVGGRRRATSASYPM